MYTHVEVIGVADEAQHDFTCVDIVLICRVAALVLAVILVVSCWIITILNKVEILAPVAVNGNDAVEVVAQRGIRQERLRVVEGRTVALVVAILEGIAELQERGVGDRLAIGCTCAVVIRCCRRQVETVGLIL